MEKKQKSRTTTTFILILEYIDIPDKSERLHCRETTWKGGG